MTATNNADPMIDHTTGIPRMTTNSGICSLRLNQLPINAPINPKAMLVIHPFFVIPARLAPTEPQIKAINKRINILVIILPFFLLNFNNTIFLV